MWVKAAVRAKGRCTSGWPRARPGGPRLAALTGERRQRAGRGDGSAGLVHQGLRKRRRPKWGHTQRGTSRGRGTAPSGASAARKSASHPVRNPATGLGQPDGGRGAACMRIWLGLCMAALGLCKAAPWAPRPDLLVQLGRRDVPVHRARVQTALLGEAGRQEEVRGHALRGGMVWARVGSL